MLNPQPVNPKRTCSDITVFLVRSETKNCWLTGRVSEELSRVSGLPSDIPLTRMSFLRGRFGKPILPRGALGDVRCFFNVSHCVGWIALAYSHIGQVGVDIEEINPDLDLSLTATPCSLSVEEQRWLNAHSVTARPHGFLLLWTRKEALLKAIGSGIACSLARVPALPSVVCGWRLRSFSASDVILSVAMRETMLQTASIFGDGTSDLKEITP